MINMQVNVAIGDFSPLMQGLEPVFRKLKESGADGVELGIGLKSRWTPDYCTRLSRKYGLPIVSAHQPLWAAVGLLFDERAFATAAQRLGVRTITCHPLPRIGYDDPRMKRYFERLAHIKQETGLEILVENLPEKYNHPLLNAFFPPSEKVTGILELHKAASEFNLNLTLDTDHLQSIAPHMEAYFETLLPTIKNIHLSSFEKTAHHLPIFLGDLKAKEFVNYLQKNKYDGLLTLEIGHPSIKLFNYDFEAIRRSIEIIKS